MPIDAILEQLQSGELDADQLAQVRSQASLALGALARSETAPLPAGAVKRITLPGGAAAVFYKRKGRALVDAQRAADGDAGRMAMALLAQVVEIDGRQLLMEDLEDLDLMDVLKLQEAFGDLGKLPGRTA